MAQSFTADTGALAKRNLKRRSVLVTGAAGNIGSYFAAHAHEQYDLRLMVREGDHGVDQIRPFGQIVTCDLADLDSLKRICQGIDTVLHLAANPNPNATWNELLPANIVGTYNAFVAAKSAGCRRVVYASSIHAVSSYPADYQVHASDPVNPGDLYGVTKCFGEALARYMAEQEGLSAIAIRIGGFQTLEYARDQRSVQLLDAWVSNRDLHQLFVRCIDVENVKFAVLHGLSNNRFKRLDISDARELVGYDPVDDVTRENPKVKDLDLAGQVSVHNLKDGQKSGIREELKEKNAPSLDADEHG